MNLVPGMQKTILRKVIRQHSVACELAQKISDLRLMAAHQFTECIGILLRHHQRDEVTINLARLIVEVRIQLFGSRSLVFHRIR